MVAVRVTTGFAHQFVQSLHCFRQGHFARLDDQRHQEPVFLVQMKCENLMDRTGRHRRPDALGLAELFNKVHDHSVLGQHPVDQQLPPFSHTEDPLLQGHAESAR